MPHDITATARSEGTAAWFDGWLTDEKKDELARWWKTDMLTPLIFTDVLHDERARALSKELKASTAWERECYVELEDQYLTAAVDETEYRATPEERRFSNKEALRAEDSDRTVWTVRRFLAALEDREMSEFLEDVTGVALDPRPASEFSRHSEGDFLKEHSDLVDGRRLGLIVFLNEDPWEPSTGGHFAYRNQKNEITRVPPIFNSMTVFPFLPECSHRAELVSGPWVRYSVAIHYLDDGSRGQLRSRRSIAATVSS